MEYLGEIVWYISLPTMIYVAIRFVNWNLGVFEESLTSKEKLVEGKRNN